MSNKPPHDQRLLDLYDCYAHGLISRRQFLDRAAAGFIGFAPDGLTPLGGYPGNDEDGGGMLQERDRDEMLEDFVAAVRYLQAHEQGSGVVDGVDFCYGGSVPTNLPCVYLISRQQCRFTGGNQRQQVSVKFGRPY